MGADDVLEIDAAVQQLVDLDVQVVVGGADVVAVVGLGEEPRGPQDQARQPLVARDQLAQILGRGLGRAIDVAGDRGDILGDPGGRGVAGGRQRAAERAGRAREDEPAGARRNGLFEQDERAGDVRRDELRAIVRADVGLVERRRVHDRVDAGQAAAHARTVGDRADDAGRRRLEHVEPDDLVAVLGQDSGERLPEVS